MPMWKSILSKSALWKLASLTAAATLVGAALIVAPAAQARGGGGGGWHGGGGGWHGGGGGWHGAGAWHGAGMWRGAAWRGAAWHGRFSPHRRFAFFHRHRFVGPFFGLYAAGYSSCWSWAPTPVGWRRVWVCDYPYGYL
jgi:hypothetical protein